VLELDPAGVRRISRSPSFAIASFDFLNRSGDVDEEVVAASAEPRRPFSRLFFECQARCRIAKAVYALVSMTDLKVSVTANTGHAGAPADAAASMVVN